jgi:hypothetical protein
MKLGGAQKNVLQLLNGLSKEYKPYLILAHARGEILSELNESVQVVDLKIGKNVIRYSRCSNSFASYILYDEGEFGFCTAICLKAPFTVCLPESSHGFRKFL